MKSILTTIAIICLFSLNGWSQKSGCEKFKNGKFRMETEEETYKQNIQKEKMI